MKRYELVTLTNGRHKGQRVLANVNSSGYFGAITYANRTQAAKRAEKLHAAGVNVSIIGDRPFYVAVHDEPRYDDKHDCQYITTREEA